MSSPLGYCVASIENTLADFLPSWGDVTRIAFGDLDSAAGRKPLSNRFPRDDVPVLGQLDRFPMSLELLELGVLISGVCPTRRPEDSTD